MSIRKQVFLLAPAAFMFIACGTEVPTDNVNLHKRIKADGNGGLVETDRYTYYANSGFLAVGKPQAKEISGTAVQQKPLMAKAQPNPSPYLKYNRSIVAVLGNPNTAAAISTQQTSGVLYYRIWIPSYDPANPGTWSPWGQSNNLPDTDTSDSHPMYNTRLGKGKWQLAQDSNNQTVTITATLDDGSTQTWTGTWSPDSSGSVSSGRGKITWTGSNSK